MNTHTVKVWAAAASVEGIRVRFTYTKADGSVSRREGEVTEWRITSRGPRLWVLADGDEHAKQFDPAGIRFDTCECDLNSRFVNSYPFADYSSCAGCAYRVADTEWVTRNYPTK